MDREQHLVEFSVVILALVLLLVVLSFLHRRHLMKISDRLAEGAVDNGPTLKQVVIEQNDATRLHVSQAVDGVRHDTEMTKIRITDFVKTQAVDNKEFRGQLTVQKARLAWVIGVTDALAAKVRDLFEPKQPPKS